MTEKSPHYVPVTIVDHENDQAYGGQYHIMRCGPATRVAANSGTDPVLYISSALEAAKYGLPVGYYTDGTIADEAAEVVALTDAEPVGDPFEEDPEAGVYYNPQQRSVAELIARCGGLATDRPRRADRRHNDEEEL